MALTRQDWNLLAIAAAGGAPLSPVQLQKVLFLLGCEQKAAAGKDFYSFSPYNYGPFDKHVYEDAEALAIDGLVQIQRGRWADYSATGAGLAKATKLEASASADAVAYLRKVVQWARSLSFQH